MELVYSYSAKLQTKCCQSEINQSSRTVMLWIEQVTTKSGHPKDFMPLVNATAIVLSCVIVKN